MNFAPRKGLVITTLVMSAFVTLVFGTIVAVNVYWQLRDPTPTSDFWGWLGAAVVTYSCIAMLLFVTTATLRIKYDESGLMIFGLGGRRFVPWSAVMHAHVNRFKGNVELTLKAEGRRMPISVPLTSYQKAATLLEEIRRRLPVAINDPGNVAALLPKD